MGDWPHGHEGLKLSLCTKTAGLHRVSLNPHRRVSVIQKHS